MTKPEIAESRRAGWQSADILRTAALVIAMYIVVRMVWVASPLALTAFLGILFGLAVSAGVDRLARWRIPRGLGAALVVLAFFGVLAGFGAWMAPTLQAQGSELRRQLPDAIDRVQMWIDSKHDGIMGIVLNGLATEAKADSAVASSPAAPVAAGAPAVDSLRSTGWRERLGGNMGAVTRYLFPFLTSTVEAITGFIIIIFLSIYIAVDPAMYRRGIIQLFPYGRRERIGEVLSALATILRKWLVTQLIAMVVIGSVSTIVLLALGVKAAFALGLLSGLFEFIPTLGPILSALPAIAMGFLDSPEKAAWVAAAYVAVQFLENHLLIPLLMKGGVNLPPALTILTQALMALLFGFLGLMCAVPALAAVMVAVQMLYVEDVVGDPDLASRPNPVLAAGT